MKSCNKDKKPMKKEMPKEKKMSHVPAKKIESYGKKKK